MAADPAHNASVPPSPEEELTLLQAENDQLNAEIVQLKEQLSATEDARDRYADLYDFVSVACLTLDRQGAITEVNRRTISLLRWERQLLVGTPLMVLVVGEHRRRILDHLAICNGAHDAVAFDVALRSRDGSPIPVRVTLRANQELGGGYAVAMMDMRALQNAQAEQQRLVVAQRMAQAENQARGRLIANMSSELRGLMTTVLRAGIDIRDRSDLTHEMRAPLTHLLRTISSLKQRMIRLTSARIRPTQSTGQVRGLRRIRARRLRIQ